MKKSFFKKNILAESILVFALFLISIFYLSNLNKVSAFYYADCNPNTALEPCPNDVGGGGGAPSGNVNLQFSVIVCDNESDLPNWSDQPWWYNRGNPPGSYGPPWRTDTGPNNTNTKARSAPPPPTYTGLPSIIYSSTAQSFVNNMAGKCHFEPGWRFSIGPGENRYPQLPLWSGWTPTAQTDSNGTVSLSVPDSRFQWLYDGWNPSERRLYVTVWDGPGTYGSHDQPILPQDYLQFSSQYYPKGPDWDAANPNIYSAELRCWDEGGSFGYGDYAFIGLGSLGGSNPYSCIFFTAKAPSPAQIDVNATCPVQSWTINPGSYTGSGTFGSYSPVTAASGGTSYTIGVTMQQNYVLDYINNSKGPGSTMLVAAGEKDAFNIGCHQVPPECPDVKTIKQCPQPPYNPGTYTETTTYTGADCSTKVSTTNNISSACTVNSQCNPNSQTYTYADTSGTASCAPDYEAAGACQWHCPSGQSGNITVNRTATDFSNGCPWNPWTKLSDTCQTPPNPTCTPGTWSQCSASCGGGTQSMTDSCDKTVTQTCNTQSCQGGSCTITYFPNDNFYNGIAYPQWQSDATSLALTGGPFNDSQVPAPNGSTQFSGSQTTTLTLKGNGGQCSASATFFGTNNPIDNCGPLTAPQNFTATPLACGTGQIRLSWSSVCGATQYEIWRGGQPPTGALEGTVNSPNTTFTDNAGLNTGWRYDVRAVNNTETGPFADPPVGATALGACSASTITVNNNTNGTWTINPGSLSGSGSGSKSVTPGNGGTQYSITADSVSGYYYPPLITNSITGSGSSFVLNPNQSGSFTLNYTPISGGSFDYNLSATTQTISGQRGGTAQNTIIKTLLSPTTWTQCAVESDWPNPPTFCAFSGTKQVRYGANGTYNTLTLTNGTDCSNTVFGDPVPGTKKHCEIASQSTQAVDLSATNISGIGYSFSGQTCSPTCSSNILFNISQSAPLGQRLITVTGTSANTPNKTTSFNLNITDSPTLNVTCTATPASAPVGTPITWRATSTGGSGTFTSYSWSGTNIPANPAPTSNPYTITYTTVGQKTAQATVTDSGGKIGSCTGTVTITFNPNFKEF